MYFRAAGDGHQKVLGGYRRSGAQLHAKKPRDLGKQRDFFLSLTLVKLASSLPSILIFLGICRTPHEPSQAPWISPERKKPALPVQQPATRGRLPAHGHNPPSCHQQLGTGDWQHRETTVELEEGQRKPGKGRGWMFWQGRGCGQSPGHCSRACTVYPAADTAVCEAKAFIRQLHRVRWKGASSFLAQRTRVASP